VTIDADAGADAGARVVRDAPAVLAPFNAAGVLGPAAVHGAVALCGVLGEERDEVLLAAALALAASSSGHVCLDLDLARGLALDAAQDEADAEEAGALPWPADVAAWRAAVATSPLLHGDPAPLALVGGLLYLQRYRRYEQVLVDRIGARAGQLADDVDDAWLEAGLDERFGPATATPDRQRLAVATAVRRRLAIVTGGPGTGKTTAVARLVALLDEQPLDGPAGSRRPRIALAAFSGKAAARLGEVVGRPASTLHRLLGPRPGSRTRFRHGADQPLPHDVVIVDEASMVGVALMAKLLDAVRDDARLVLVGDAEQLRSVEAGAVLRDLVRSPALRDAVVVLDRVHRFAEGSGIAALAAAVRGGRADDVMATLRAGHADVGWISAGGETRDAAPGAALDGVRGAVTRAAAVVVAAARSGDAVAALDALGELRVLCAHRRGPYGVAAWNDRVEGWLAAAGVDLGPRWYEGRPVLVTANDPTLRLFNGDLGVVVRRVDGGVDVAFSSPEGPRRIAPSRLEALETVHALTVHKGQGSQVRHAVVVLAPPPSPLLTRELLYTALTRAQERVTLLASEEAVRAAVDRPLRRVSGLVAGLGPMGHPPRP